MTVVPLPSTAVPVRSQKRRPDQGELKTVGERRIVDPWPGDAAVAAHRSVSRRWWFAPRRAARQANVAPKKVFYLHLKVGQCALASAQQDPERRALFEPEPQPRDVRRPARRLGQRSPLALCSREDSRRPCAEAHFSAGSVIQSVRATASSSSFADPGAETRKYGDRVNCSLRRGPRTACWAPARTRAEPTLLSQVVNRARRGECIRRGSRASAVHDLRQQGRFSENACRRPKRIRGPRPQAAIHPVAVFAGLGARIGKVELEAIAGTDRMAEPALK